ncbi:hypothetical protein SH591_04110 [Sphingomonas sp. LY54]|uniref:hypothetical protein n=1 Tax=Sphingomonas sp. LY54 TaxID=3095343 RepID=UPI002D76894E|nr:hypothetical protein [Sphingomonas sp. LY54]WRP29375.1 hypothetical protein SH591_04110 [Sphingomonas sp. LY54]
MSGSAYDVGQSVGTFVGYIVIYGGILALGVYAGKRLTRAREDGSSARWPLGSAVALVLLLLLGQCSAALQAGTVGAGDVVILQRAAGPATAFPSTFSQDFIANYDKGLRQGLVDTLRKAGATVDASDINVSTAVMNLGAQQLLKSKVQVATRVFMYQFAGVAGTQVITVVCASGTAEEFQTAGTECERRVEAVFGG